MTEWKSNTPNNITIMTTENVDLHAYFVEEENSGGIYTEFAGTWTTHLDKHILSTSLSVKSTYIIKVVDFNNNIEALYAKVRVVDSITLVDSNIVEVAGEPVTSMDQFKGLTQEQHDQLMQIVNYDDKALKNLAYAILGS